MECTTRKIRRSPGIYYIRALHSKRTYIGSSVDCYKRLVLHRHELIHNKHRNSYLQRSYNKYGSEGFKCGVIEYCTKEELYAKEQKYCDEHKSNTFNLRIVVESNKGIKKPPYPEEAKERLRNPSDETRRRMRESHLGYVMPEEQKRKISEKQIGKTSYNVEAATIAKYKQILQINENGEVINTWGSVKECYTSLGMCASAFYNNIGKMTKKYKTLQYG